MSEFICCTLVDT